MFIYINSIKFTLNKSTIFNLIVNKFILRKFFIILIDLKFFKRGILFLLNSVTKDIIISKLFFQFILFRKSKVYFYL